jgi:CBS-domain-containing membrane protein
MRSQEIEIWADESIDKGFRNTNVELDTCRTDARTKVKLQENMEMGKHKKTKLRGLSRRANYTDRATAACRLVPTFADRGCHVVSVMDPYGRILGFLGRNWKARKEKIITMKQK